MINTDTNITLEIQNDCKITVTIRKTINVFTDNAATSVRLCVNCLITFRWKALHLFVKITSNETGRFVVQNHTYLDVSFIFHTQLNV